MAFNPAAPPAKPKRRRLRRVGVAVFALGLTAVLLCTVFWPWTAGHIRSFNKWQLERQLADTRQELPEVADFDALRQQQVTGTNGWTHLVDGSVEYGRILRANEEARTGSDTHVVSESLAYSFEEMFSSRDSGKVDLFPDAELAAIVDATQSLPIHATRAAEQDCIVMTNFLPTEREIANPAVVKYLGCLTSRVCAMLLTGRSETGVEELMVLSRVYAKLDTRYSKAIANAFISSRNSFLEHCVVRALRHGHMSHKQMQALLALKWHTPSTDPVLWLNNAAWTWQHIGAYEEVYADSIYDDEVGHFPFWGGQPYRGLAQWMAVSTDNVASAREGELNLRDWDWLDRYQRSYRIGLHPINAIVGCGRETMHHLAHAIKEEDELWAEIEELCVAR